MINIAKQFLLLWRLQLELFNQPPLEGCEEAVVMMKQDCCLAKNVSDCESHQSRFSGCPCYESDTSHSDSSGPPIKWLGDFDDFQSDLEDWELDASFPELKINSQYEEEDWDKELEDAECNPYDAEDIDCGSLQENYLLASYAWQEESLYNPMCHHTAPLALNSPNRMPEVGQFDDADD
ncbi:coordinator of PRMT5 and differentiation stimulator isoform X3 [Dermochelys coriacea]|uniref:coordinator of PRMT5 and differentiation stimulator isoform X3 n=1 Tax=Dermochelys coriacea TaxID=27794 RepID=UPI001CA92828|nr:coordinator of PRMT5 and differentiation stimulator isoform X3 [Dermochelys coriacea]XP_043353388.1 coordinator of PRMT5 and differentiation stimulator isoform X3 [Dermochelys coriacea]XP_043353389.1 coordinator of PRMT5 and differentiation stimulator isoform X3 [Dermochelys coriacea]XP_043353390.1 coordinator of PRMT5 and differentiation stimulator isoform X3 [Dermochelys coriacea]XP_043353391.1 coordinator of PRMT5 and differentiation stimulator isoform X3 [Dermochelys coriacea]